MRLIFRLFFGLSFGCIISSNAFAFISQQEKQKWLYELIHCDYKCKDLAEEKLKIYKSKYPEAVVKFSDDTQVTLLYLHSYTLSPLRSNDNRVFLETILKDPNVNVIAPIFTAHHMYSTVQDFKSVKYEDWWLDSELSLFLAHHLGKKIVLQGYSMGGLFSVQLAKHYPQFISKLILISPLLMFTSNTDHMACIAQTGFVRFLAKTFSSQNSNYLDKYLFGLCPLSESVSKIRDVYQINKRNYPYEDQYQNNLLVERLEQLSKLAKDIHVDSTVIYSEYDEAVDPRAVYTFAKNLDQVDVLYYSSKYKIRHLESQGNYIPVGKSIGAHQTMYNKIYEVFSGY